MSSTEAPPIVVNFRIFIPRVYVIKNVLSLLHQSDQDLEGEIYFDDLNDEDEELEKAIKILLQSPPADVHLYI
jgi:hypothetical protein